MNAVLKFFGDDGDEGVTALRTDHSMKATTESSEGIMNLMVRLLTPDGDLARRCAQIGAIGSTQRAVFAVSQRNC